MFPFFSDDNLRCSLFEPIPDPTVPTQDPGGNIELLADINPLKVKINGP